MRLAEVALLALTLVGALRPMTRWRRSAPLALVVVAGTVLAGGVHAVGEGPRWQMAPVYLAALGTAAMAVSDARRPRDATPRRLPALLALVLVVTAAALGWALPVTSLPEPPGSYPVGTRELVVVDEQRVETYGDRVGEPRRLALQLWYPATAETEGDGAWTAQPEAFARTAAEHFDVPAFTLSHLGLVRSHAVVDAPLASGSSRPVVLYSHGWSGFRTAQSTLLESLASRGFIVAAVDHTHASLASVFPDGTVVPIDPAALPEDSEDDIYAPAAERLMEVFAADLESVVDHLRATRPLGDAADLTNLGLIGHSTGGGAAILACGRLTPCRAVVGYDPWVEPLPDATVGADLQRPLLSLRSEEWTALDNDTRLRRLHAASSEPNGLVTVEGSVHRDFTLAPLLSPLSSTVPINGDAASHPEQVHRVVDEWTAGFLSHHLRGARTDPLEDPPRHPRAHLER